MLLNDGTTFAAKAREQGPAILDWYGRLWRDETAPLPIRLRASQELLDRGFGKAQQNVNVTAERPLVSYTMDELEALIAAGEPAELGDVIEGSFTTVTTTDSET